MTFCEFDLGSEHHLQGIESYLHHFIDTEWRREPITLPVFDSEGWLVGSIPIMEKPSMKAFLKAVIMVCVDCLPEDIELPSSKYLYIKTLLRYRCSVLLTKEIMVSHQMWLRFLVIFSFIVHLHTVLRKHRMTAQMLIFTINVALFRACRVTYLICASHFDLRAYYRDKLLKMRLPRLPLNYQYTRVLHFWHQSNDRLAALEAFILETSRSLTVKIVELPASKVDDDS